MTKAEAITNLSEMRADLNCFNGAEEPYYRALSMAIESLSETADDLISRQAAIDALAVYDDTERNLRDALEELPSAQPDMSEYSDRLWKAAYERGKREAQPERKKGKWSEAERQKSQIFYCSVCGGRVYYPWIGSRKEKRKNVCRYAYCPYCNADMRGEQP